MHLVRSFNVNGNGERMNQAQAQAHMSRRIEEAQSLNDLFCLFKSLKVTEETLAATKQFCLSHFFVGDDPRAAVARGDPFTIVPVELIGYIFGFCGANDIKEFACVNKTFNTVRQEHGKAFPSAIRLTSFYPDQVDWKDSAFELSRAHNCSDRMRLQGCSCLFWRCTLNTYVCVCSAKHEFWLSHASQLSLPMTLLLTFPDTDQDCPFLADIKRSITTLEIVCQLYVLW